jgi:gp6-like head-tail connector protein
MSDPAIIEIDYLTLPTALLPLAKQQMRVDFDDEDEFITNCVARAIDYFQLYAGFTVFGTEAHWEPSVPDDGSTVTSIVVPVFPVSDFDVTDDTATDVSTEYQIRNATSLTLPPTFSRIDGAAIPAGLAVRLILGVGTDLTKLPPAVTDRILRVAAMLYDQRETIVIGVSVSQIPMWVNDLLIGAWVPRC